MTTWKKLLNESINGGREHGIKNPQGEKKGVALYTA
jgi:hypothetical protein